MDLKTEDIELIKAAKETIFRCHIPNRHHIGTALRAKNGQVFSAVHLETYVGSLAVCAETIAIGMAAVEGLADFDTIVSVNQHGDIVAPCGRCREVIYDYSKEAKVLLCDEGETQVVAIQELLPSRYERTGDRRTE